MARFGFDAGPPAAVPDLDEDARAFCDAVVALGQRDLGRELSARDREGTFDREAWAACARLGLLGLPVPEEHGGTGASALTIAAAMEALGYACADNGLIFSLGAQMWAVELPLVKFGTPEQRGRFLPGLCDGSLIAAHGMSEPDSGSDAFALSTRATPADGGWRLNGSKTFVTNAPVSDLFVVFATLDPALGFAGLCAFLLPRGTDGLEVGPPISKMGVRTSPMSELFLSDCLVGPDQLLGSPGGGMTVFTIAMRWERALILAGCVGAMHRQLQRCIAYARERSQFGAPIGSFQGVSHKLADMRVRLETARMMLYRMARKLDDGSATDLDAAMTKLHLSECFVQSSLDALQIHGGYGYMTEYGLEREVRDALATKLYSGTSDLQRNVIAAQLGLGSR